MSLNSEVSRFFTQPLSSIDWGSEIFGSANISYSFANSGTSTTFSEEYTLGEGFNAESWNTYEKNQFRAVFEMIENITNITFNETGNYAGADLRLMLDTNEFFFGDLGVMIPPGEFGDGLGVFNGAFWNRNPGGDLEMGGFSFTTMVHELLHGMGLAHPHDTGGLSNVMTGVTSAFDDYGTYDLNQGVYTAMTYNTGLHTGNVGGISDPNEFNFGYEAGPMALDIAVLQDKYGANMSYNTGGNTYDLPGSNASGTYWMSIWDAGGTDMIRYQGNRNVTIDLREATLQNAFGGGGYISAADGIQGGFTIANGVVIERAQGGNGNDRLIGNIAANNLSGTGGNDTLKGDDGNDKLYGGDGRDRLEGGEDRDLLRGNAGDDSLFGGNDIDTLQGGDGNDRLQGDAGDDQMAGENGNDTMFGNAGNDNMRGDAGNDRVIAGRGNDTVNGDAGNDEVNGGNGNDYVYGSAGTDTMFGGKGNDTIKDNNGAGTFYGNKGNDRMDGGANADLMVGGNGNDTIIGFEGNDTITGGSGFDTFIFYDGFDQDRITDHSGGDRLRIDDALLTGQTTGAAVVAQFGNIENGHYTLNFGNGDKLWLEGVTDLTFLENSIDIF